MPKLPGPQSKFMFGNTFEFGDDPLHCISNFIEKYGLICQYWYYSEPVVLIADANLVEYVLSTNSSNYVKERDMFVADIVGNGLLVSKESFGGSKGRSWYHDNQNLHQVLNFFKLDACIWTLIFA